MRKSRPRLAAALCLVVLLPILPLYIIRQCAEWLVEFIDWAVQGRAWCKPFLNASDAIERRLTDPHLQHWRS